MANSKNTGSTLTLNSGQNKTSTGISTHILITVNNSPVGAIQQMQVDENRQVKMIDEIGTDGHIDSVPVKSVDVKGSCQRVRFDRLRITEAFKRGWIHLAAQRYPFDIVIVDKQKNDESNHISTVYKNVWITSLSTTYNADNWVITENMSWEAETVFSIVANAGMNVAQGGEIGSPYSVIGIEREVDRGANGRRGALDASGLIDLADGVGADKLF